MNTLLLIYAAVLFIASIVVFTIGQLLKDKQSKEEEPDEAETPKWMRVFAGIGFVLALICLVAAVKA